MKLIARDVAVGYNADKPIQRFVNFSVQSGEVCCILGPNGCGKTTLVKSILGINPLLSGSITLDGSDIPNGAPRESRRMLPMWRSVTRSLFPSR